MSPSGLSAGGGGERLEVADELLASAHEDAMVEHTRRHPPVDALHEAAVLEAHLCVERHQLVDPVRADVAAEEVVEEPVRPVRRQRHHRADRDVRAPGEDVHPEVRPQEVELRALQLAVEPNVLSHRPALARQPPFGRQRVRVGGRVDHRRERGMRDLAVIALEEVLADDLPVGVELRLPSRVEDEIVDVEPELVDLRGHRAQRVCERLRIVRRVHEHEGPPSADRGRQQPELLSREIRLLLGARCAPQGAVETVRPRVVGELQRLPPPLPLGDGEAPVTAHVHERAQLVVFSRARDHDRRSTGAPGEERPRLGHLSQVADVLPCRLEDELLLAAKDLRIRVPAVRERALHGTNLLVRAMVLSAQREPLELRDLPVPDPGPGQVRLRVRACGVCRTDLHVVDGDLPNPKLPLVLGHQLVGEADDGRRLGVPWLGWTDGTCRYCTSGRENLCDRARFTGYDLDGGYAEYAVADERYCLPIPDGYDDLQAAPLLCAGLIGYRSLRLAGDAERLGLYGFGASAHIVAQVARHQGRRLFGFVRRGDDAARAFALQLGCEWAGWSDERPPEELDAAILFAHVGPLVPAALAALAKGGRVICAGIHMSDIPSFGYELLWEERSVSSVANLTRQDGEEFLAIAPEVPVRTEIEVFALEAANDALDRLRRGDIRGAAVLRL